MPLAPTIADRAASVAPRRPSRLWLWLLALVALQLSAWITWLVIAARHRVAEVPIVTSNAK